MRTICSPRFLSASNHVEFFVICVGNYSASVTMLNSCHCSREKDCVAPITLREVLWDKRQTQRNAENLLIVVGL